MAYFAFGARTTKPPAPCCTWGVRAVGKVDRQFVGIEGCDFKWNGVNANQLGIEVDPKYPVNIDAD